MKPANEILAGYGTTVFEVMSRLAMEHRSVNLGQGFPDEDGPEDIREAGAKALMDGPNQYPLMMGVPAISTSFNGASDFIVGENGSTRGRVIADMPDPTDGGLDRANAASRSDGTIALRNASGVNTRTTR